MQETIIDSFLEVVTEFPKKEALFYKENHHFSSLSYEELYTYSQRMATYMKELGVKEGDRILLVSENRPEWVIVDLASLILGAILVPVHSVLAPSQMAMIAEETEPKITFVSDKEMLGKILEVEMVAKSESFIGYFNYDLPADDPLIDNGKVFYVKEKIYDETYLPSLEPVKHKPERVITIIYTSGTTGRFKGVELTNENLVSNLIGLLAQLDVSDSDRFLSVLPLSHVFERTLGYYLPIVLGATISYVLDPAKLAEMAAKEKPTIILGVPRLYEKVYQAVVDKSNKSIIKKILFSEALKIGKKYPKNSWQYRLADKMVFQKVKKAFGGHIRFFVSGSASLQPEIIRFFDALNLPVLEGYGLTETSPLAVYNVLNARKVGTIGKPPKNMEIKVVKGELWVKGPSVFKGYYKNPEKTKEAFPEPGWFNTGDLVEIGKDGYIRFVAREKEIIALSTGKKVSPMSIEEKLELVPCIGQAFVFGDNKKHIGALIVPEKEKTNGLAGQELWNYLAKEIDEQANQHLSSYEQIKKFVVIKKDFSVNNGLLTPTLKLRRKEIETEYAKEIESVYEK